MSADEQLPQEEDTKPKEGEATQTDFSFLAEKRCVECGRLLKSWQRRYCDDHDEGMI
jgi:hypothetical protein